jgi:hypothetical protein
MDLKNGTQKRADKSTEDPPKVGPQNPPKGRFMHFQKQQKGRFMHFLKKLADV